MSESKPTLPKNATLPDRLARIERLETELLRKAAASIEKGFTIYHADWFVMGAIRRTIAQSNGFRGLISARNVLCAAALLRMQLDTWDRLNTLPESWRTKLEEWRAIYLIHDMSDGKNYVGSAYGEDNLDHRWAEYVRTGGHGGNVQLRGREPNNFLFSILELVGPSMPMEEVVEIERSWMLRLHTRTGGLNS